MIFYRSECLPQQNNYSESKAQQFLKNLYAFKNIKQIMKEVKNAPNEQKMVDLKNMALNLSLKQNFVTDLTSLVVVKPLEKHLLEKSEKIVSTTQFRPSVKLPYSPGPYLQGPLRLPGPPGPLGPQSGYGFGTRQANIINGYPGMIMASYDMTPQSRGTNYRFVMVPISF